MNRQEHLLTIVGEEGAEITQRATKANRFGLEQVQQARDDRPEQNPERLTNRERILEEFYDLVAVLDMLHMIKIEEHPSDPRGVVEILIPREAILAKQAKVEHYLRTISTEHGTLTA
jgi:hypothetical protein